MTHTATKFCMVIKLEEKNIFTGSTPAPMLTCDLFAAANFLDKVGFWIST